jgi:hypothetical protein
MGQHNNSGVLSYFNRKTVLLQRYEILGFSDVLASGDIFHFKRKQLPTVTRPVLLIKENSSGISSKRPIT